MRKRISFLLAALLVITFLTGCGVNDLEYLKLSREISKVTEFKFENETKLELTEALAGNKHNIDLKLTGSVNVEKLDSIYLDLNISAIYNDIKIENPVNFKLVDNKLYVSKIALLEIIKFVNELEGYNLSNNVIEEVYNAEELKDIEYIFLEDLGHVYNQDVTYDEILDMSFNYLTKAFNGFDSKIISKTSKGYKIELDDEAVIIFVENLLNFLDKNRDLVFDETIKYLVEIYNTIDIADLTEEDITAAINELNDSRQDYYDFIDQALVLVKTEEFKNSLEIIKGSKINNEIYKDGNSYVETSEIEVLVNEVKMGKLLSNTKITPADVEKIQITEKAIEVEKLEEIYDKTENRINPVQKMELNWFDGSTDLYVSKIRLDGNEANDTQPYIIIEGRIYLPLRYICESFGEEVEWDDVNKKAYIVRDTEKIDMTGTIVNSRTMIKVRDFEKLGYIVGYEQVDGFSRATIEK